MLFKNSFTIYVSFFTLEDLGKLHYFIGIEVTWQNDGGLHLSQNKYIVDLL